MLNILWICVSVWCFVFGAWCGVKVADVAHKKEMSELCAYADEELNKKDKLLEDLYIEYKHLVYRFKDAMENSHD